MDYRTYLKNYPDKDGRFGPYGGAYLTDELVPAFEEIADAYQTICHSSQFINELRRIRKEFQGRPTPVYHCERLSKKIGNCQIYLKREDLNHTGAHKLNHCMGEGLLAKFMGKKRLIAETGADSTAWPWQRPPPSLAWNARYTWARWTLQSRRPMLPG